jgi:exonuclease III
VCFWNAGGLPDEKLVAQDDLVEFIQTQDILAIWDTHNNDAAVHYMKHSHDHYQLHGPAPTSGNGALLFVKKTLAGTCKSWFHPGTPLAWVKLPNIAIGFLYAKPEVTRTAQQQTDFLASLQASINQQACDIVLLGDFNARLGACHDCSNAPRNVTDVHNPFGRMLMQWCKDNGLMTLTGRHDEGQPSRYPIGDQPGQPTRIDHAFTQPHAIPHVQAWRLHASSFGSDHLPLCMTLDAHNSQTPATRPVSAHPKLSWDYDKQATYASHVHTHQALRSITELLMECHEPRQLDHCDSLLKQAVMEAAVTAGLVRRPRTTGPKRPTLHLNEAAVTLKHQLRLLYQNRQPIPATMRQQWRRHIKEAKKQRASHLHKKLREWLHSHPRIFWSTYKSTGSSASGVMATDDWRQFYQGKFNDPSIPQPSCTFRALDPTSTPCPLTQPITVEEVEAACKKVGTAKAVGIDGIPSEFITHTRMDNQHTSPLHVTLASLFTAIVQLGHMPASWKPKVISPVFKKGPRTEPNNYRPISVATSIYRIFAAVLAMRLTEFMSNNPDHLSPSQFAFQKKLSTNHAHLILQTCCDTVLSKRGTLAIVRLDISKAYDTVLREKLWQLLEAQNIPAHFTRLIQEVYRECPYHIKVNGEVSAEFFSNLGVQQGCPLSPWAYNEYIAAALKQVHALCVEHGVQLYDLQPSQCTHVGWADDIIGTVKPEAVEAFVAIVQQVFDPINQHLGVDKTEVLLIQHRPYTEPTFAGFKAVLKTKILGLLYNHKGCMSENITSRTSKAQSKAIMHSGRLKSLGCLHDITIAKTMLESDVRSSLLFGEAIWGHYHISGRDPMKHPMQKAYSTLGRHAMGLPHGTAHWNVAMLFGLMPIQHWIVRGFVRFWNNLLGLAQHNVLLRQAARQQASLLQKGKKCWLRRWRDVLCRLLPAHAFHQQLQPMLTIDEELLLSSLEHSYHVLLATFGDPSLHPCPHRRIALCYNTLGPQLRWHRRPVCMSLFVPRRIKATWIAFIAAACTTVPVNDYTKLFARPHPNATPIKIPYQLITCRKCTSQVVADEEHLLLHCPSTAFCRQTFQRMHSLGSTLREFLTTHHSNKHAAFFVYQCMCAYSHAPDIMPAARPPVAAPTLAVAIASASHQHTPTHARHSDSDSTTTANLGALSASEYDSDSDLGSEDLGNHFPGRTENQSLLYMAQMSHRRRLRVIED